MPLGGCPDDLVTPSKGYCRCKIPRGHTHTVSLVNKHPATSTVVGTTTTATTIRIADGCGGYSQQQSYQNCYTSCNTRGYQNVEQCEPSTDGSIADCICKDPVDPSLITTASGTVVSKDTIARRGLQGVYNAPVGSAFSRQYCLNGEIETESCSNFRLQRCASGKCVELPVDGCLNARNDSSKCVDETDYDCHMQRAEDCVTFITSSDDPKAVATETILVRGEWATTSTTIETPNIVTETTPNGTTFTYGITKPICGHDMVNYTGQAWKTYARDNGYDINTAQGGTSELIGQLGLDLCVPDVPIGLEFYSESEGSYEASADAKDACDVGSYTGSVKFYAPWRPAWHCYENCGLLLSEWDEEV